MKKYKNKRKYIKKCEYKWINEWKIKTQISAK